MPTRSLLEAQAAFAAALVDPARPVPEGIVDRAGRPAGRRFAIYRNNVVAGLTDTLRSRFPVVARLVGEAFFRGMAGAFVREHRPASPLLIAYGDDFPDFIAGFGPAAEIPYLADVARLEAAWSQAHHAAEALALTLAALAEVPQDKLAGVRLVLHPSVRIVGSPYPIASLWAAHQGEGPALPPEGWEGEDVLVARPEAEVLMHRLPAGGLVFLTTLKRGASLGEAAHDALDAAPSFDLARNLAGLFGAGAVINLLRPENVP